MFKYLLVLFFLMAANCYADISADVKNDIIDEMLVDIELIYFKDIVRETALQLYENGESLEEIRTNLQNRLTSFTPIVGGLNLSTLQTNVNRSVAIDNIDETTPIGVRVRALIEVFNKKDNNLVNRINDIIAAAATGGSPASRLDAIAAVLTPNTRTKAEAVQDYKDEINSGNQDS